MPAAYQELFLEKGTSFSTSVTMDSPNGLPYDLTGAVAKAQIRKSYYSSNATAEFVTTIPVPAIQGVITLSLSAAVTANIAPGRYVYDVLLKDQSNTYSRVVEGIVNVTPQVTADF